MRTIPTKTKAPSRHENYLHKSLFAIFGFDPDSTLSVVACVGAVALLVATAPGTAAVAAGMVIMVAIL